MGTLITIKKGRDPLSKKDLENIVRNYVSGIIFVDSDIYPIEKEGIYITEMRINGSKETIPCEINVEREVI